VRVNLKLLASFCAVAEHMSFRKAADELRLSLPAVSVQIKQLEEQLGVALFQRTTRKVTLTREGEELLIGARKSMAELEGALARVHQAAEVQHGHLSLACVPTLAGTRLPALLVEFARLYPAISVRVRESPLPALLDAVRRCEVDFGIGPLTDRPMEFDFRPIFQEEYVALLPRAHAAARRQAISLRELAKMPLMTISGSYMEVQLRAALQREWPSTNLNYDFTSVSTMTTTVEAGLGVAIIPAIATPRSARLKALRIVRPTLTRTISVVKIRGYTLSPAAARFVELIDLRLGGTRDADQRLGT